MKIVDVEPIIGELYKIGDEKDKLGEHEFALGIDTVIYLLEQAKEVDAEPVKSVEKQDKRCLKKEHSREEFIKMFDKSSLGDEIN